MTGSKTHPGEALAQNLEDQTEGYHTYAHLLQAQRKAMLQGNIAHLSEANALVDTVVTELLRLEVDREAWVQSILEDAGARRRHPSDGWLTRPRAPEPTVKCEELARHLPPDTAQRVLKARDALKEILSATERAVKVNQALAENGQRMVAATLASMTLVANRDPRNRLFTYTRSGATQSPFGKGRQTRNLVNRSA